MATLDGFDPAATLDGTEKALIWQGGQPRRITTEQLADLYARNGTIQSFLNAYGGAPSGGGGGGSGTFDLQAALTSAAINSVTARQIARLSGSVEFNVLHYGADRTGVTDSTAAIQSCLDAVLDHTLATGGGCNVYVPAGRYLITSTLRMGVAGSSPSQMVKGVRFYGDAWGQVADYGVPYAEGGTFFDIRLATAGPFITVNTPWVQGLCSFEQFTASAQYSPGQCTIAVDFPNNSFVGPIFKEIQTAYISKTFHISATAANGEFGFILNCASSFVDMFLEIEDGESYGWIVINSGGLFNANGTQYKLGAATNTGAGLVAINGTGTALPAGAKSDGSRNFLLLDNHGASPCYFMGGRIEHISCLIRNTTGYNKVTFENMDLIIDAQTSVTSPVQMYPYVVELTADASNPGIGGSNVQFRNCRIGANNMAPDGSFIKDFPIYNHDNILKFQGCHFGYFVGNAPVVTNISGPNGGYTEFTDCFVSEGSHFDGNQYELVPYNAYFGTHFWDSAKRGRRSTVDLPRGRQNNLLKNPHIVAYADDLSGTAATVLPGWTLSTGAAFPSGTVLTRGTDAGLRNRSSHPDARTITLPTGATLSQVTTFDFGTFPATELGTYTPFGGVGIPMATYHAKLWPVSGNLRVRLLNSVTGEIHRQTTLGNGSMGVHDIQLPAVIKAPAALQYLKLELAAIGGPAVFYLDHHFLTNSPDGTYVNGGASAVSGTEWWSTNASSVRVHSRLQIPRKSHKFGKDAVPALADLGGGGSDMYIGTEDGKLTFHNGTIWVQL